MRANRLRGLRDDGSRSVGHDDAPVGDKPVHRSGQRIGEAVRAPDQAEFAGLLAGSEFVLRQRDMVFMRVPGGPRDIAPGEAIAGL